MSEVVPLPSFGEVFFDERGQERVLRVTWHDGTLVLSLWRGEMCTASFRMPMDDVARLVDTLDEGFVEAGGRYPDEVGEDVPAGGHPEHAGHTELPGTGQYARPRPEDYAQPVPPPHYADPAVTQMAPPHYADPMATQVAPPEEQRPPALGPNDVLVARGAVPPPDAAPDRVPGYGAADVVPPENMIVGDSLPYGAPQPGEPPYPGQPDPYAQQVPQPDPFAPVSRPATDPFAAPPSHRQADPFAAARQPDVFTPAQPDPYAQVPQPDPYAQQVPQPDLFTPAPQQGADPFAAPPSHRQAADPFAPPADRFPPSQPDAYPSQGHSTDPYGIPPVGQQPDPYGYPAPAQPDPYAFGNRPQPAPERQAPPGGHPADLRDLYSTPPAYDQPYEQPYDPDDPLNLRAQQAGQHGQPPGPRSYPDAPHSTGERLRPEQGYDDGRRDW
ncbi:hypothetical protein Ppa06_40300 [Planomonospora parontospora subsp. parontospora]|uniref:Uncharacterized protein n=2 Tax=Planomonospora parontospora TaxID=58119 RepID=A0AA37F6A1_9ACTN|nr:hypothetical protein [Planomonospora parontospora]GGK79190.1 hypothetical protein GCM10010126_43250 [Planomonospora parontospora]GII10232.1 hypothetical protein Ppa06_40300 [Planomonospora parontospora subsp. parontospora]